MSRLLRLYPRAWRQRYGPELASILEAQPPTLGDRFDLLRGAADAHLHPELVDRDAETATDRAGSALAGLLIGLGSAFWLAGVITVASQPLGFGDRDGRLFGYLVPLAALLYAAGILRLDQSAGVARPRGAVLIVAFAAAIVPMAWPIAVFGYYGLMLTLGWMSAVRAFANRWPSWLAAAISIAGVLGLGTNTETGAIWLAALPPTAMALLALMSVSGRLQGSRPVLATEGGQA